MVLSRNSITAPPSMSLCATVSMTKYPSSSRRVQIALISSSLSNNSNRCSARLTTTSKSVRIRRLTPRRSLSLNSTHNATTKQKVSPLRSPTYYRIRLGVRVAFWATLAVGLVYLVGHINWVGNHYCWGTIAKCYGLEG